MLFRQCLRCGVLLLLHILSSILIPTLDWRLVAAQEAAYTFTIAQGISHALSNSREFQIAQKDVELADEKVKEARAALLPQLMLDTGYTFDGDLPTIVLDGDFPLNLGGLPADTEPIEIEMGATHNFQGRAQATYPLFTWGQLGNIYRQAVLGKQAAERTLEAVQLDIELKVRQAFHGVLLAQAFVDVTEQSLAQVERRYELAQQQKAAGVTTRLEVIRANVQVVNTRSQLIQAQNQCKLAEENLKLTLGFSLDDTVLIDGNLHAELKSVNVDQAIATALERRPEIRQIEIQEQIGEKQVKVAKAGNKPRISTFGNYIFNDSERQSYDTSWSVGVAIQFPIFDGFATRARVNQARVNLDQIQTTKAQLIDGIKLEAKSAVFGLEATQKLIDAQKGIVEQAAEGLRIANVQYEAGLITGVELTDVELSHTQAQVNHLQAIHDYIIKPKDEAQTPNLFFRLWDRGMESLERGYARILGWSLRYLWVNVLIAILLIVGAVFLGGTLGGEFIPKSNGDFIIIGVELAPGTTLVETDEITLEMEAVLRNSPEVKDVLTKIGRSGGTNEGVEYAELLVILPKDHKKHVLEVNEELRSLLEGKFPGVIRQQILPGTGGLPGGADIEIQLLGNEKEKLIEITSQVKGIVDKMPELVETKTTVRTGKPEITFLPDRNRLKDYGITVAEVGQVMSYSLTGAAASTYEEGDEEYDIRVQLAKTDLDIAENVGRILIRTQKGLVPLSVLGDLIERSGETQIARRNKQRLFVVEANIIEGSLGSVTGKIQRQVDQINLPPGYQIRMGGDAEEQAESFQAIGVALMQAILLTYMLLAALLGSYLRPFIIMLTLPLGFVGAVLSMSIFGLTINIFSLLAIIMLVGIVVNDAILLLDQTHIFRQQGLPVKEALLKACPLKLRTIIMTNLTIIVSMFPQTLGDQGTAIMRATLAGVEIGAIIVQTICTLTIIPVLYTILDRFSANKYDADVQGSTVLETNATEEAADNS